MTVPPADRRRFLAACGSVLAAGLVGGCSATSRAQPPNPGGPATLLDRAPVASAAEVAATPTAAAIRARGQLVIGGDLNLPLLSQQNPVTGQTEGFDADLGRMLAKYIVGKPATQVVPVEPQTRESLLELGTVDTVIRIYSITAERSRDVAFAGPYFLSGQAIATLKSTRGLDRPRDLDGHTVAVVANTTSEAAVQREAPRAKVIVTASSTECVQKLEQHKADAYVHDLTVLAGSVAPGGKIKVTGRPFTRDPYGIGLRRDDNSFKAFINRWLAAIEERGLWKAAYERSIGTVVPGPTPRPPRIGSVAGS